MSFHIPQVISPTLLQSQKVEISCEWVHLLEYLNNSCSTARVHSLKSIKLQFHQQKIFPSRKSFVNMKILMEMQISLILHLLFLLDWHPHNLIISLVGQRHWLNLLLIPLIFHKEIPTFYSEKYNPYLVVEITVRSLSAFLNIFFFTSL